MVENFGVIIHSTFSKQWAARFRSYPSIPTGSFYKGPEDMPGDIFKIVGVPKIVAADFKGVT